MTRHLVRRPAPADPARPVRRHPGCRKCTRGGTRGRRASRRRASSTRDGPLPGRRNRPRRARRCGGRRDQAQHAGRQPLRHQRHRGDAPRGEGADHRLGRAGRWVRGQCRDVHHPRREHRGHGARHEHRGGLAGQRRGPGHHRHRGRQGPQRRDRQDHRDRRGSSSQRRLGGVGGQGREVVASQRSGPGRSGRRHGGLPR